MRGLLLSIFPGIDLLGMAFEEEGFCVVRGPDVLWGGDVRTFHPPVSVFDGVIGGPPCQAFSTLAALVRHNGHEPRFGNLIPEFERCVAEAAPRWFLMENVRGAPIPGVKGYVVQSEVVTDHDVGGQQRRARRFSFGSPSGSDLNIRLTALRHPAPVPAVTGRHSGRLPWMARAVTTDARQGGRRAVPGGGVLPHSGRSVPISAMCELQGLPADFTDDMPFTMQGKRSIVGNGVPLPMGRAVARAVCEATRRASVVLADREHCRACGCFAVPQTDVTGKWWLVCNWCGEREPWPRKSTLLPRK